MSLELVAYGAFFLTMALTYAIIALGLNVQWGQTGLFNVGVAGFVAIGAYTSALLTTPDDPARFGGFSLLLGLAYTRLVFGSVDPCDDLPGLDKVAFAHRQALQFARHPGLDKGGVHRLDRARDGQHLLQVEGLGLHHFTRCQLHRSLLLLRDLLRLQCLLGGLAR